MNTGPDPRSQFPQIPDWRTDYGQSSTHPKAQYQSPSMESLIRSTKVSDWIVKEAVHAGSASIPAKEVLSVEIGGQGALLKLHASKVASERFDSPQICVSGSYNDSEISAERAKRLYQIANECCRDDKLATERHAKEVLGSTLENLLEFCWRSGGTHSYLCSIQGSTSRDREVLSLMLSRHTLLSPYSLSVWYTNHGDDLFHLSTLGYFSISRADNLVDQLVKSLDSRNPTVLERFRSFARKTFLFLRQQFSL